MAGTESKIKYCINLTLVLNGLNYVDGYRLSNNTRVVFTAMLYFHSIFVRHFSFLGSFHRMKISGGRYIFISSWNSQSMKRARLVLDTSPHESSFSVRTRQQYPRNFRNVFPEFSLFVKQKGLSNSFLTL